MSTAGIGGEFVWTAWSWRYFSHFNGRTVRNGATPPAAGHGPTPFMFDSDRSETTRLQAVRKLFYTVL